MSLSPASPQRRRRAHAAAASPLPVPAVVQPVAGTAAAERAAAAAIARRGAPAARPHVLLDPDLASRPAEPRHGMPAGMSPTEIADRIVAKLLAGSGPILLCVPGTLGAAYQSSMLATARAFAKDANGPVSVASIPYPNGVKDVVTRFVGIGTAEGSNVLALVLQRLHAAAPGRPVLLTGESQGAWMIAQTLRENPVLAASVTRIALFAIPGFVQLPDSIGGARDGAAMLTGDSGILEFRHTDDIVPSLFSRFRPAVLGGYVDGLRDKLAGGKFGYRPHHYEWHGHEAARWLLLGERPAAEPVHPAATHPQRPVQV